MSRTARMKLIFLKKYCTRLAEGIGLNVGKVCQNYGEDILVFLNRLP